jgi:hypothetical protein
MAMMTTDRRTIQLEYEDAQRAAFAAGRWAFIPAELLQCGDYVRDNGIVRVLAERRTINADPVVVFDHEQQEGSGLTPVDRLEFIRRTLVEARRPDHAHQHADHAPASPPPFPTVSPAPDPRQLRRTQLLPRPRRPAWPPLASRSDPAR